MLWGPVGEGGIDDKILDRHGVSPLGPEAFPRMSALVVAGLALELMGRGGLAGIDSKRIGRRAPGLRRRMHAGLGGGCRGMWIVFLGFVWARSRDRPPRCVSVRALLGRIIAGDNKCPPLVMDC